MSAYGTTTGEPIWSARSPKPEPRMRATLGLLTPRAVNAWTAADTRAAVDATDALAPGIRPAMLPRQARAPALPAAYKSAWWRCWRGQGVGVILRGRCPRRS